MWLSSLTRVSAVALLFAACTDSAGPVTAPPHLEARVSGSSPWDDFHTLDPARWTPGDHPLGRGAFRRENVAVDAGLVQEWSTGVPTREMHVLANVWWPTWLAGPPPEEARQLEIDWIRWEPR